ncbi:MAG: hypothetical protein ACYCW6_26190 [Candidatus Xenobia bacterium]
MPAVACVACKSLVDTNDPFCKKCNEKKPFQCSKCDKRLGTHEVFEPEKLVLKKPVFCTNCGQETSHVQCANCKTHLVRSAGRERSGRNGAVLVYHEDCWKTYEMQVRYGDIIRKYVTPVVGLMVGALSFYQSGHSALNGLGGAAIGAMACLAIAWMVSPKN